MTARLYRMKEVRERTGLATSTIYLRIREGVFPAPIALEEGSRSRAWIADEVDEWVLKRIRAARGTSAEASPAA